jgi:hypothetical protein
MALKQLTIGALPPEAAHSSTRQSLDSLVRLTVQGFAGSGRIDRGPLFPLVALADHELAARGMTHRAMYNVLMGYLEHLPGAMQEEELPTVEKVRECVFSPHSMLATTATLLLDSRVPMELVQDLLDHKHITTTQIYDKRRRSVRNSASHRLPIERAYV